MDIIAVEYESLIEAHDFNKSLSGLGKPTRLLDVGCGTAIFPRYLDGVLADDVLIKADLLDISPASLERAADVLDSLTHFTVSDRFLTRIEDIPDTVQGRYDIIWAIHSLTTVEVWRMERVFIHLLERLARPGLLYVYQLTADSAYQTVHSHYLERHGGTRYMEFEDSLAILDRLGIKHDVVELSFDHVVSDEPDLLDRYLQKVVLDTSVTAADFSPIVDRFRDGAVSRFPQTVNLIVVNQT